MTKRNDISVPSGYFESLEGKLNAIPRKEMRPTMFQRVSPWMAYAASLAILAMLGTFILRKSAVSASDDDVYSWDYISYLAGSLDPDGQIELEETESLSDEDIMSYLLASNLSLEEVLSYEESY